jgi:eukaryotic-like serine/threonine-protein kinase
MSDTADRPSDLSRIFSEFLVRRQRGESPILDEYCQRFPDLAEQLRQHVHLYDAFGEASSETGIPDSMKDLRDLVALALNVPNSAIDCVSSEEQPQRIGRYGIERLLSGNVRTLPQIPGYEVESVLGHGGMGIVYRALQRALDRPVAVKMLLAGSFAGQEELERFRRETAALGCLRHPNIVQVHDAGDIDGRPYFTMELVEGGSLAQRLSGTPQPAHHAAALVAMLTEAVQAAHQCGILHCDLKPSNILLTLPTAESLTTSGQPSWGTPKISDFGLARPLEGGAGLTQTGVPRGTPSYMAPEQARGDTRAMGPAVDVYGLGAILYELLTGRPPFRAETPAATLRQVLDQEPAPPSRLNAGVPRDLETICLKCLHKVPARRYADARSLAEDLGRFLAGKPIKARPVSVAEHAVKWARRRPAVALLLGALVVMAASAAGVGIWVRNQEGQAREAVKTALGRADQRRSEEHWLEASLILAEAESHLADANSPQLEERLRRTQSDVRNAADLERVRESCPLRTDGQVDYQQRAAEYQEAFDRAGLRIGDDPTTVATFIRASAIRDQLIAAVEDRALVAYMLGDVSLLGRLLEVARLADPEPGWRNRFRQVAAWRKREQLLQLAAEAFNTSPAPPAYQMALLGCLLSHSGADSTAIQLLSEACRRQPGNFWLNREQGTTLVKANQTTEAAAYYRAALALRPDNAGVHELLGIALFHAGQTDEALVALRRAVELPARSRSSRQRLVAVLAQACRWAEAAASCRKSLDTDPTDQLPPLHLAMALYVHERDDDVIAACRLAIGADSNAANAYYYLGLALMRRDRHDEAITAFHKTTELRPDHGAARHLLAEELVAVGRPAEALTEIRTGIARNPNSDDGLYRDLGALLRKLGHAEETAAAFRKAADLNPAHPEAWDGLAAALLDRGRFADARAAMECLLKLPTSEVKRRAQRRQLDLCDALLPVEASLPANLAGKGRPESASAQRALAEWCLKYRRLPATAASFYEASLAIEPSLADDLEAGHRFHAACAAAFAACGVSEDATLLDDGRKKALRRQALDWLTAEYNAWAERHRLGKPGDRTTAATAVRSWLRSEYLVCVRDEQALTKFPPEERRGWQALWAKAAVLAARDPAAQFEQARTHVARTEWKKAAECYAEGMELEPTDDSDLWFEYAAVQLLSGDREGYRRSCAHMLARCRPNGPISPYLAARACTLAPDSADDPELPCRLAQSELERSQTAFWSLTEQAALQHRGTQIQKVVVFQDPVLLLRQSLAANGRPGRAVLNWLWLALAHRQRGNTAEARLWLGKAIQWLEQQGDQMPLETRDLGLHRHDWLEAHVLRKEAAGLLAAAN